MLTRLIVVLVTTRFLIILGLKISMWSVIGLIWTVASIRICPEGFFVLRTERIHLPYQVWEDLDLSKLLLGYQKYAKEKRVTISLRTFLTLSKGSGNNFIKAQQSDRI